MFFLISFLFLLILSIWCQNKNFTQFTRISNVPEINSSLQWFCLRISHSSIFFLCLSSKYTFFCFISQNENLIILLLLLIFSFDDSQKGLRYCIIDFIAIVYNHVYSELFPSEHKSKKVSKLFTRSKTESINFTYFRWFFITVFCFFIFFASYNPKCVSKSITSRCLLPLSLLNELITLLFSSYLLFHIAKLFSCLQCEFLLLWAQESFEFYLYFFEFFRDSAKREKKESKSWAVSSSFGLRVIVQDVYMNTKQRKIIYLYVKWAESKLYSFLYYFTNLIYFPSWSISCLLYDVVF